MAEPSFQTLIIIPTLNEADNIVKLIRQFQALPHHIQVVVADSNSPDGTAQQVEKAFPNDPLVSVLPCGKRGRGASVVHAYDWALKNNTCNAIAVCDADFSHTPKDFPSFLSALSSADVIVGSRYIPGSTIENWPLSRRMFSFVANTTARILLNVGIRDYTNGYRLATRKAIASLPLHELDADGFIHLSQEIFHLHRQGFRIKEVPIYFVNRERGKSNFKPQLITESISVIFRLAMTRVGLIKTTRQPHPN